MRYLHLLSRVYNRPHLILPEKLEAIRQVITSRAFGLESATELALQDTRARQQPSITKSVAVLPIVGTLAKRMGMLEESSGGMSTDRIGQEIDRLMADEQVGAIVLDIDSPGGESFGVRELSDKIYAARDNRKPIIAVANPEAASAAYYIGSAAKEFIVTPSGWVGSVGVVMAHTDQSLLNESLGVKVTYITAAKYKTEGNANEPLSDDALVYYQSQVDQLYEQFVKDVARNRATTAAEVRRGYGEGRMLLAADAKAAGMVDRVDTLENVIAKQMARIQQRNKVQLERLRLDLA
jgi:signal peptide peptidase SppA